MTTDFLKVIAANGKEYFINVNDISTVRKIKAKGNGGDVWYDVMRRGIVESESDDENEEYYKFVGCKSIEYVTNKSFQDFVDREAFEL